jgi:predicted dehydrogenase/nucleoside-diphosphate-sugar epimerase
VDARTTSFDRALAALPRERSGAADPTAERAVCLVGAGNIAAVHAEVLQGLTGLRIAAIVDPNAAAARRLASRMGVPQVHGCVTEALRCNDLAAAHVLTPPPQHAEAALPFLRAGVSVLLEKPLATSRADCDALRAAAQQSGATLGVNQNFVFHPAFARLRAALEANLCGPARSIDCSYSMPLRQLAARQFGHWMFAEPGNLLLEQAVHPLSQLIALAGPVRSVAAIAGREIGIAPGQAIFPEIDATLACARLPAQLRFALGQAFPVWQVRVICDDGMLVADMVANRFYAHRRTRWLEPLDLALSGVRTAAELGGEAVGNLSLYGLSALGLRSRSDPFFRSMRDSLAAFHAAATQRTAPECSGAFGSAVVAACEAIAEAAIPPRPSAAPAAARPRRSAGAVCDVAVLGGSGFIGTHTVRRLAEQGRRVSVLARSPAAVEALSDAGEVVFHRGDIRDGDAVSRAIGQATVVVNLAHGGGGESFDQVRQAMVGGAQIVARAVQAAGARRLVHVSSIAALYLGDRAEVVTGATPADPQSARRADYARAKALCEAMLLELHAHQALPVTILRPGLVVGAGASPFHSGLGLFNNDQHCIGWNAGRNPLPFVLVDDVAQAIDQAAGATGVEGRCYNLVGDVRPSAREFLGELARATGRPLVFHGSDARGLWVAELAKWTVKRLGGRAAPLPELRELRSRGLAARFDCDDAKRDLGWTPVADRALFFRLALESGSGS